MIRAEERKLAAALKAVDVRVLLRTSLPDVLPQLTATHIDQLQRVLDVAVINADLEARGEVLDRQSIKGRIIGSDRYLRDPVGVARRDKVLAQKLTVKPAEGVIRLNLERLLTADALRPRSDNPDEATYLAIVGDLYEKRGVWLLLDSSAAAVTQKMHPSDLNKWRVRLILGQPYVSAMGELKEGTGRLTQDALLSVSRLAAGYWEWVYRGPTLTALEREIERVSSQITAGRNEHFWWSSHRSEFYATSRISDLRGGAHWPDTDIWDMPFNTYLQARQLKIDGKLREASKFALLAAFQAEWCSRALHEYIKDTRYGASRVVAVLEIAVVFGKIAEAILSIIAVHGVVTRLLGRKGSQAALQGGGQRQLPAPAEPVPTPSPGTGGGVQKTGRGGTLVENTQPPLPPPSPKRLAGEVTPLPEAVDNVRRQMGLPGLRDVTLPGGWTQHAQTASRLHNEFVAWLKANPNASMAEKLERLERVTRAEWGSWFPTR